VYAVLRPIRVVLTNYPEDKVEFVELVNNPEDESSGKRMVPLSRTLYIDSDDFMENPSAGFFRLSLGGEVRLKYAFCIICTEVVKDESGQVVELRCTYDEATRRGVKPEGRPKVKGTIHWVSAEHAVDVEVRLYDRLFTVAQPEAEAGEDGDFTRFMNPASLEVVTAKIEPSVKEAAPGKVYQFERVGYFFTDPKDSKSNVKPYEQIINL
jgi:glutaminyl-tRNA synthetase